MCCHHLGACEPRPFEGASEQFPADTVQSRGNHDRTRGVWTEPYPCRVVEVAIDDRGIESGDERTVHTQEGNVESDGVDTARDLGVGGGNDLRAVAQIHLVAIVLRRVVACGHHHARRSAQAGYAPRQQRRWLPGRQHHRRNASCRQDAGRVPGEVLAPVAGVEADHHTALTSGGVVGHEIVGKACCGLSDDEAVHPVRTGTQRTAQTRRAELESGVETIDKCCRVTCCKQCERLLRRDRIGVVCDPGFHPRTQRLADGHAGASSIRRLRGGGAPRGGGARRGRSPRQPQSSRACRTRAVAGRE
ncbi:unannotated protein [freshwater metagenome]|uniref:Unannotated protein n=1 Tax=freshwater metagenome TaxID=449393 RepID=A0A6J6ZMU0_9ZZZZ